MVGAPPPRMIRAPPPQTVGTLRGTLPHPLGRSVPRPLGRSMPLPLGLSVPHPLGDLCSSFARARRRIGHRLHAEAMSGLCRDVPVTSGMRWDLGSERVGDLFFQGQSKGERGVKCQEKERGSPRGPQQWAASGAGS